MNQLDHRRVFGGRGQTHHIAKIDGRFAKFGGQLLGQPGDFLGAPVHPVNQRQQLAFGDHRDIHLAAHQAANLVIGLEIGRIGEADPQQAIFLTQHQRPETAGLGFAQQLEQFLIGRLETAQVDEGHPQLPGQRLRNTLFGDVAAIDEDPPQLAPGCLLLIQRSLELLLGQQALLDQQVAEADFLRGGHPGLLVREEGSVSAGTAATRNVSGFCRWRQAASMF